MWYGCHGNMVMSCAIELIDVYKVALRFGFNALYAITSQNNTLISSK